MKINPLIAATSCAAIALTTAVALAGPASATSPASAISEVAPTVGAGASKSLASVQAKGAAATSQRISALNAALPKVTANGYLTAADKAQIVGTLDGDLSGMHTVAAKIAADTMLATAVADYQSIFTEYRVYLVALPQARFAAAADDLTGTALGKLTDAHTELVAALAASGNSTPQLQADLTDMSAQITAAQTAITGVAAAALAVTPAAYDANHAVLDGPRGQVRTALGDVKRARADAAAVTAALK